MWVLRRDPVGELVEIRLAHDRVPRCFEPGDRLRRALGHVLGEHDRAVRRTSPAVSNRSLTASRIPSAGRSGRARKIDTQRLSLARASFRGPHACGELDHERDGVSAAPARVSLLPAGRLPAC